MFIEEETVCLILDTITVCLGIVGFCFMLQQAHREALEQLMLSEEKGDEEEDVVYEILEDDEKDEKDIESKFVDTV